MRRGSPTEHEPKTNSRASSMEIKGFAASGDTTQTVQHAVNVGVGEVHICWHTLVMSSDAGHVRDIPPNGLSATWHSTDGLTIETLSLSFENESWTVEGFIGGVDVQYVMRLSATWQLQQMLLFRDLDEPDLWLANDGGGKWGEVNGSQIRELGGCQDIDVRGSSFTRTMGIRRLAIDLGTVTRVDTAVVNPETLGVTRSTLSYTRVGARSWSIDRDDDHGNHQFDVDEYGLPLDIPGHFQRLD